MTVKFIGWWGLWMICNVMWNRWCDVMHRWCDWYRQCDVECGILCETGDVMWNRWCDVKQVMWCETRVMWCETGDVLWNTGDVMWYRQCDVKQVMWYETQVMCCETGDVLWNRWCDVKQVMWCGMWNVKWCGVRRALNFNWHDDKGDAACSTIIIPVICVHVCMPVCLCMRWICCWKNKKKE